MRLLDWGRWPAAGQSSSRSPWPGASLWLGSLASWISGFWLDFWIWLGLGLDFDLPGFSLISVGFGLIVIRFWLDFDLILILI